MRDQNIHFLGFQHQGRKEGTACFHLWWIFWWMWGWGGSSILEHFLPSVSAENVTPTSPQLHCANNPKFLRPSAAPCWEIVHLQKKTAPHKKTFFLTKQQTKMVAVVTWGISCWGVTMALAVGCCKHPTESPRTKHQLPVKDVYSSPDCQLGWRRLHCWGNTTHTCKTAVRALKQTSLSPTVGMFGVNAKTG